MALLIVRFFVLLAVLAIAACTYRWLASSRSFHRFVTGITDPEPVTDDEVEESLQRAHKQADDHVVSTEAELAKRQQALNRIRSRRS